MRRRCVSFVGATSGAAFSCSQVAIALSSVHNRSVHPFAELERNIEDVWAGKLEKNPHLFNGTKFRLASMQVAPHALHMQWGLTDYKTYIGLCSRCEVVEKLKADGASERQDHTVYLSNKIGVAAALVTSDNKALGVGWENMPSESDDALNARCVDELFDSIVNEIHEEVNVPKTALASPLLLGVTLQGEAETPSFAFLTRTTLPADEISALYKQGPLDQYETTQLVFQPLENVTSRSIELTPSAAGCIQLLQEYCEHNGA
ncbi:unnamed protein product [Aphanomyces euteiches]